MLHRFRHATTLCPSLPPRAGSRGVLERARHESVTNRCHADRQRHRSRRHGRRRAGGERERYFRRPKLRTNDRREWAFSRLLGGNAACPGPVLGRVWPRHARRLDEIARSEGIPEQWLPVDLTSPPPGLTSAVNDEDVSRHGRKLTRTARRARSAARLDPKPVAKHISRIPPCF
jgi:hypothetical protein